jgi:hypothetical protein
MAQSKSFAQELVTFDTKDSQLIHSCSVQTTKPYKISRTWRSWENAHFQGPVLKNATWIRVSKVSSSHSNPWHSVQTWFGLQATCLALADYMLQNKRSGGSPRRLAHYRSKSKPNIVFNSPSHTSSVFPFLNFVTLPNWWNHIFSSQILAKIHQQKNHCSQLWSLRNSSASVFAFLFSWYWNFGEFFLMSKISQIYTRKKKHFPDFFVEKWRNFSPKRQTLISITPVGG